MDKWKSNLLIIKTLTMKYIISFCLVLNVFSVFSQNKHIEYIKKYGDIENLSDYYFDSLCGLFL